jgi:hypothetical protein
MKTLVIIFIALYVMLLIVIATIALFEKPWKDKKL